MLALEVNSGSGGNGTAGDYRAWLTPTRPGTYTLRLVGSIRSQPVDESFTSAENTFDEVEEVANIQFPAKDPSAGQLATRIEREVPRLGIRTDAVEAALASADERVDHARTLAMVAMLVGALGLLTVAGALVIARGRALPRGRSEVGGPKLEGGGPAVEREGSTSR